MAVGPTRTPEIWPPRVVALGTTKSDLPAKKLRSRSSIGIKGWCLDILYMRLSCAVRVNEPIRLPTYSIYTELKLITP